MPLDALSLIGRRVVDRSGRPLGRVVAVIRKAAGTDVLIERRHLLRRRAWRCRVEALLPAAAGAVEFQGRVGGVGVQDPSAHSRGAG